MSGKKVVLVGDLGTDHQGFPPTPVISGSPNVLIDGKPVARVSDQLTPIPSPNIHPTHAPLLPVQARFSLMAYQWPLPVVRFPVVGLPLAVVARWLAIPINQYLSLVFHGRILTLAL